MGKPPIDQTELERETPWRLWRSLRRPGGDIEGASSR